MIQSDVKNSLHMHLVQKKESNTLKNCIKAGKNCDVLLQNKKKNGEIFYSRLAISAVIEQDIIVNYIGVIRDITDKIHVKYEWSPNAESGFFHLSNYSHE